MRVIKGIQTSLVAMGVSALLIGCGGGGGSSSGSLTTADPVLTISGVVSDGGFGEEPVDSARFIWLKSSRRHQTVLTLRKAQPLLR